MALDNATRRYSLYRITPTGDPRDAVEFSVNLGPNQTLKAGTILGQVTTAANDVQTLTITGTPTGGSVTLTGTNPLSGGTYSLVVPYNGTSTAVQALVNAAVGSGNLTVGGGALPGTALTFTGAGLFANMPIPPFVVASTALTGGTTPAAAVTHTTTGATPATYVAYDADNEDGSEVAKAILPMDCATDAGGRITEGSAAVGEEWGETWQTVSVYFKGYFMTADLVGLDSTAVESLGKLISGSLTNGIIRLT